MAPSERARMLDLSVVTVSYNTRELIQDCLQSVTTTIHRHSVDVIVVDNASSDGSVAMLRKEWPQVRVLEAGANVGFARASNLGMRVAEGRHFLLLNPDTVVQPGALDQMITFLDHTPACGVAAPKLVYPDFSDQGTARAFPSAAAAIFGRRSLLTKLFPGNRWSRRYLTGLRHAGGESFEVDWVSGACMMVPRRVADQVGLLDEGFFMHWEDADWCRRIKDAGYSVFCVADATVVHHEGGSRRGWPPLQVWVFHQGAFRFFAKHHAVGGWRWCVPVVWLALSARAAAIILLNQTSRSIRWRHT